MEFKEVWKLVKEIKTPFFTRNNGEDLFNLSLQVKNGTILEIGSAFGFSSSLLGLGAKLTNSRLYCIDPWMKKFSEELSCISTQDMFGLWQTSIKKSGCADNVTPLMGASSFIRKSWDDNTLIDSLFIDGTHNYCDDKCLILEEGMEQHDISERKITGWLVGGVPHTSLEMANVTMPEFGVKVDFDLWSPLIKTGGYIALHDINFDDLPAVTRVWQEEITSLPKRWRVISDGGHLGIAQKIS